MKDLLARLVIPGILLLVTVTAAGAALRGWFLPSDLRKPVSIREGSATGGRTAYWLGTGRSHYGGGYRGGK
jgi:hypothetical protein